MYAYKRLIRKPAGKMYRYGWKQIAGSSTERGSEVARKALQ
jgi:hypothetical protein